MVMRYAHLSPEYPLDEVGSEGRNAHIFCVRAAPSSPNQAEGQLPSGHPSNRERHVVPLREISMAAGLRDERATRIDARARNDPAIDFKEGPRTANQASHRPCECTPERGIRPPAR